MKRCLIHFLIAAIWFALCGDEQVSFGSFEPKTVSQWHITSLEADSWVGKTADDLTAAWGEPTRIKQLKDGGRLLVYRFVFVDGVVMAPGTAILVAPGIHHADSISGGQSRTDSSIHSGSSGELYMTTRDFATAGVVGKLKAKFRTDRFGTIVNAKIPAARLKN